MLLPFKSRWDEHLGRISTLNHELDLRSPTIQHIHSVPYCAGRKACNFKRSKIANILAMIVEEPAQPEWPSLVHFAPKKDGTLKLCVDYRKLTAVTVRAMNPLAKVDDRIDSFGVARVLSTLNVNNGCWHTEGDPSARKKTALTFHPGL